jgi:hypothetical protein
LGTGHRRLSAKVSEHNEEPVELLVDMEVFRKEIRFWIFWGNLAEGEAHFLTEIVWQSDSYTVNKIQLRVASQGALC